jgi:hypothetical protein
MLAIQGWLRLRADVEGLLHLEAEAAALRLLRPRYRDAPGPVDHAVCCS